MLLTHGRATDLKRLTPEGFGGTFGTDRLKALAGTPGAQRSLVHLEEVKYEHAILREVTASLIGDQRCGPLSIVS